MAASAEGGQEMFLWFTAGGSKRCGYLAQPTVCCAPGLSPQADPVSEAKLKAAAGLAALDSRRYKAAARAFVSVNPELGTNYSDVSGSIHHSVRT